MKGGFLAIPEMRFRDLIWGNRERRRFEGSLSGFVAGMTCS